MGFVWNAFNLARDYQKGITIQRVHRFDDLGPGDAFPYSYSQGDLTFELGVAQYSGEWRRYISYNDTQLQAMFTAVYIIENPIRHTFLRASLSNSSEEYQELRQNIRDGVLALVTRGGDHFRYTPQFRAEFVDVEKDIPKPPPRPLDPNIAPTLIPSERPALGNNKNITFVYEDFGAHDAEKGITIKRIHKFEEISIDEPMPYLYSQDDLAFEFRASTYREWRVQPDQNGAKLVRPHKATYVIEESIRLGLARAKCRGLNTEEHQRLKQNIQDGMWVAETRDGRALVDVPDFRLEFVNSVKDAPRWPPRPSNRDTAPFG